MKKSILVLIGSIFIITSVLSENFNRIESTRDSESKASFVNSNQNNEESIAVTPADSAKVDSAKVQILKTDSAKIASAVDNQFKFEKGRYTLNGRVLRNKEFKALLKSTPESAKEYRKAQAQITYEIITLVGAEVVLIAVAGYYMGAIPCLVIALPFGIAYEKHLKESIRLYNLKQGIGIVNTLPVETGNITKSENKTVSPELKKADATTTNKLNLGDTVSFYSFQTNSTVKGTIIEIKDKTVVVEFISFDKKHTSEQQLYDVKKVK